MFTMEFIVLGLHGRLHCHGRLQFSCSVVPVKAIFSLTNTVETSKVLINMIDGF